MIVVRRVVLILLAFCATVFAEPPHHGEHEILYNRPSGFWTSNRPAIGGAYKYNLMLIGLGVLAITGFFTYRLLRRARSV
ncbi:MAG TPA: hypothetical protein VGG28_14925 [Kofleriaceae bacterium]|jgi:hypothetical protein